MLHSKDAYQGLWQRHNLPIIQRWIWTVGNSKALLVMACFALLLTFSQHRTWIILRYFVHLRKRAVRLDGDSHEPVKHLSQESAILDVLVPIRFRLSNLTRQARLSIQDNADSPVTSPVFGIAALFNVVLFIFLGVAIPCLISEGSLGEPLVKSRMNDMCSYLVSNFYGLPYGPPESPGFLESDYVFQLCQSRVDTTCYHRLCPQKPQFSKRRPKECIFQGGICYNNTNSFEITQRDITPYDLGLNSGSRVTMNHRLTCSPVHLDSFLLVNSDLRSHANISVRDADFDGYLPYNWTLPIFSMALNTMNGPNYLSTEASGCCTTEAAMDGKCPIDLTLLPTYLTRRGIPLDLPGHFIHQSLRRDDGRPFLVVYRGGASPTIKEVEDPFFASTTPCSPGYSMYCRDHEATALGCLEQYQYCESKSGFCTTWGVGEKQLHAVKIHLMEMRENVSISDIWVFDIAHTLLSVYSYLLVRQGAHRPIPIVRRDKLYESPDYQENIDTKEMWPEEVERLFRKHTINAIVYLQQGARRDMRLYGMYITGDYMHYSQAPGQEYSSCDRILFRNADYTNINWFGFWCTNCLFILLCIASYMIERLHKVTKVTLKFHATCAKCLARKLVLAAKTLKSFILNRKLRNGSRWRDGLSSCRVWFIRTWFILTTRQRLFSQGADLLHGGSQFGVEDVAVGSIALRNSGRR